MEIMNFKVSLTLQSMIFSYSRVNVYACRPISLIGIFSIALLGVGGASKFHDRSRSCI